VIPAAEKLDSEKPEKELWVLYRTMAEAVLNADANPELLKNAEYSY